MAETQPDGNRGWPPPSPASGIGGGEPDERSALISFANRIEAEEAAIALRNLGYRTFVTDHKSLMEHLEYGLVLLDDPELVFMVDLMRSYPDSSGLGLNQAKIAVLTDSKDGEEEAWSSGADFVLKRPFDPALLTH